jgi:uncharacterized repeat protein (TIGR03803 family)
LLYSFTGGADGSHPVGNLALDSAGDLYGITLAGGTNFAGAVFEVSAAGSEKVIHAFGSPPDGTYPSAGLVRDSSGNLYGTTSYGGSGSCNNGNQGCGTVFKIDASGKETILYSFMGGNDGSYPNWLIGDATGNLFGLASNGQNTTQDIFKIDATGNFSVLYAGALAPQITTIIRGPAGSFYGTAWGGNFNSSCSPNGCGVVFQLSPDGSGGWTENVLHSFDGADGWEPNNLVLKVGALYGTTFFGGASDLGTVFKLVP